MSNQKPRVAFFDFAGCEGCQLTVLNLEEALVDLLGLVDVVAWREAISDTSDSYDVAFVEGSITRNQDIERLKKIREKAGVVIALGACAATAGVNALKNFYPMEQALKEVYSDKGEWYKDTIPAQPIDRFVKVDGYVYGCPINKEEFLKVTTQLLRGMKPDVPDYPLCIECKMKGNVCVYFRGSTCMGPITRAGCGALCITYGHKCEGCRGMVPKPNQQAVQDVLSEYGLTVEQIKNEFNLFQSIWEVSKNAK